MRKADDSFRMEYTSMNQVSVQKGKITDAFMLKWLVFGHRQHRHTNTHTHARTIASIAKSGKTVRISR